MHIDNKKQGFSLLELLLTIAIFSIVSIGTGYLIIDAGMTTETNTKKITATLLAKEGIEAVRSIRDADGFSVLSANLGDNGLAFDEADSEWSFESESDISDDGIYTRVVNVATEDSHTKTVTSTVTATAGIRTVSVSLVTQFTDWR